MWATRGWSGAMTEGRMEKEGTAYWGPHVIVQAAEQLQERSIH